MTDNGKYDSAQVGILSNRPTIPAVSRRNKVQNDRGNISSRLTSRLRPNRPIRNFLAKGLLINVWNALPGDVVDFTSLSRFRSSILNIDLILVANLNVPSLFISYYIYFYMCRVAYIM